MSGQPAACGEVLPETVLLSQFKPTTNEPICITLCTFVGLNCSNWIGVHGLENVKDARGDVWNVKTPNPLPGKAEIQRRNSLKEKLQTLLFMSCRQSWWIFCAPTTAWENFQFPA